MDLRDTLSELKFHNTQADPQVHLRHTRGCLCPFLHRTEDPYWSVVVLREEVEDCVPETSELLLIETSMFFPQSKGNGMSILIVVGLCTTTADIVRRDSRDCKKHSRDRKKRQQGS